MLRLNLTRTSINSIAIIRHNSKYILGPDPITDINKDDCNITIDRGVMDYYANVSDDNTSKEFMEITDNFIMNISDVYSKNEPLKVKDNGVNFITTLAVIPPMTSLYLCYDMYSNISNIYEFMIPLSIGVFSGGVIFNVAQERKREIWDFKHNVKFREEYIQTCVNYIDDICNSNLSDKEIKKACEIDFHTKFV